MANSGLIFRLFLFFSHSRDNNSFNFNNIQQYTLKEAYMGLLRIQTRGSRMVGADKTTGFINFGVGSIFATTATCNSENCKYYY